MSKPLVKKTLHVDDMPFPVLLIRPDGEIVEANDDFRIWAFGDADSDNPLKHLQDIIEFEPNDLRHWLAATPDALETITLKNAPSIKALLSLKMIEQRLRNGMQSFILMIFRPMGRQYALEQELKATKEFLENLIDSSFNPIVANDLNGHIILYNRSAQDVFGYSPADVVGQLMMTDLYPENQYLRVREKLRSTMHGGVGRLKNQRIDVLSQSGEVVPVSLSATLLYEDGREVATVGIYTDLREKLDMEQALSRATEAVEIGERARVATELAGMAAHELNQPLTSVLGYADLLRIKLEAERSPLLRHAESVYTQAERMAEIVRRIGQITRHETTHYSKANMIIDLRASSPKADSNPPTQIDEIINLDSIEDPEQ